MRTTTKRELINTRSVLRILLAEDVEVLKNSSVDHTEARQHVEKTPNQYDKNYCVRALDDRPWQVS